jgi:plasmid maintenance system antidote protein VapI
MLLEEILTPLGISQSAFTVRLGVSSPRMNEVVRVAGAWPGIPHCVSGGLPG